MRLPVLLALACATLCSAVPSPKTDIVSREPVRFAISVRQAGLNFVPCSSDDGCVGGRKCFTLEQDNLVPCSTAADDCICLPTSEDQLVCTTDFDCDAGEVCITPRSGERQICVSTLVANPSTPPPTTVPPTETPTGNPPTGSGSGLTGEECTTDSDCKSPRICEINSNRLICKPESFQQCDSSSECVIGEACALTADGVQICVSEAETTPITDPPTTTPVSTTPVSTAPTTETSTTTTSTVTEQAGGVTLDPCQSTDECQGTRFCLNIQDGVNCDGGDCRCLPQSFPSCENDEDCDAGEECFTLAEAGLDIPFLTEDQNQTPGCGSAAVRNSQAENMPCVAINSINHLSKEELIFEKHIVARVLCDINESCATPGHMVRYQGKGMMMKSYCELTGCVRKVMQVNSPRYSCGLTVPSKTEELEFTALAARYESRIEEGILSTAVRFGF